MRTTRAPQLPRFFMCHLPLSSAHTRRRHHHGRGGRRRFTQNLNQQFTQNLNSELPVAAAIRFRAGHLGADESDLPDAQAHSDVVGTFGYLAPEYFMYGKVTDWVDVYAFGVVLLELLSDRKPISSDGSSPKGQESLVMWVRAPS